jgi:TonB family protein
VAVDVPTVIGWLRPMVLVPVGCFTGLSTAQIEALLAHELAHIRRHDYLVSVFQSVVEALLFYHPAVWWVSRQVRRERECCCDELAVAACGDVLAYARALSWLEQQRSGMPEIALGANGGVLTMRIRRLLGYSEGPAMSLPVLVTVSLVVIAAAGTYFGEVAHAQRQAAMASAQVPLMETSAEVSSVLRPVAGVAAPRFYARNEGGPLAQDAAQENGVSSTLAPVYKTWLTQDVRWIITDEESAAFQRMANDEERDRFIEQFWARRDPPGAAPGTFRTEHYARIAYANQHFAASKPGWMTDRGHTYIAYGKPDSIDSHPGATPYPYEVWHYHSIPGISEGDVSLTFINGPGGSSEYRISFDGAGAQGSGKSENGAGRLFAMPVRLQDQQRMTAAQAGGAIAGVVVDPTGAVVPRATVTATDTATGAPVSFTTDNTGKFSFAALPPAVYTIDVAARGFQKFRQENVHVDGGVVTMGLKLSVGAATESLTVHPQKAGSPSPAAVPSTEPILVSGGVMAQQVTYQPAPAYPPIAKAAHVQGSVVLRAIVSPQGTVENLQVVSGAPMLTSSALDAVKTWTYKPYLLNGQPTAVDTIITVHYTLPPESATKEAEPGAAAVAPPQRPVRVSSGVAAGMAISQAAPVYPEEAKAERVQGVVVLHAVISKGGEVENLQVISGPKELVASAIDAVRQWRYKPYLLNGEPTEVETTINVNYTLGDDSPPQGGGPSAHALTPAERPPIRIVFTPKRATPVLASFVPPAPVKDAAEETPTDAAGNPVRRPGGNVSPPLVIYQVPPEFTEEARKAKVGAVVIVGLVVNQNGMPENVHIVRGNLDDQRVNEKLLAGLEGKALEAVQQYRFKPAMESGQPVSVSVNIEVNLKIF